MANEQEWECQNCGNIITDTEKPATCPECGSEELIALNESEVEEWDEYEDEDANWPEEEWNGEETEDESDEEWW